MWKRRKTSSPTGGLQSSYGVDVLGRTSNRPPFAGMEFYSVTYRFNRAMRRMRIPYDPVPFGAHGELSFRCQSFIRSAGYNWSRRYQRHQDAKLYRFFHSMPRTRGSGNAILHVWASVLSHFPVGSPCKLRFSTSVEHQFPRWIPLPLMIADPPSVERR